MRPPPARSALLGPAAALLGLGALLWLERRRPLRRVLEDPDRRDRRNLAVAALSAGTIAALQRPLVVPLARTVARRRWGLAQRLGLSPAAADLLAILLLDYTLFLWHVLTHRVPLLWRFHVVHHADLDLTATTALRFHFGEMAASVPWRALQVLAVGASPRALDLWQKLTLASILFHHSNLRLPRRLDALLSLAVVTPRLHGIHHSSRPDEIATNWSSGLALWDWLHGTRRTGVPQARIRIGLPAYRQAGDLTLGRLLAQPFGPQRDAFAEAGRHQSGALRGPGARRAGAASR